MDADLIHENEVDPVEVHHEEADVTALELRIFHLEARLKFWRDTAKARARTVTLQMNDISYLRQRVRDLQVEIDNLTPPRPY